MEQYHVTGMSCAACSARAAPAVVAATAVAAAVASDNFTNERRDMVSLAISSSFSSPLARALGAMVRVWAWRQLYGNAIIWSHY